MRGVGSCMKEVLNQNLSGNEVYYTAYSLLVILKNFCSTLHCQKVFDLIPFSYKIWGARLKGNADRDHAAEDQPTTINHPGVEFRANLKSISH